VRTPTAFGTFTKASLKYIWLGLTLLFILLVLRSPHVAMSTVDEPQPTQVITEFMAANTSTLADRDGDYPDWIEIHNQETTPIDLGGWYLTDDDNDLTKWQFPSTVLAADGYLVVFASGKDRAVSGSELHTSFRLISDGEYLALVKPDGRTISWEYAPGHASESLSQSEDTFYARVGTLMRRRGIAPVYPPQFADVSYGLDSALRARYYLVPTPGTANGSDAADQGPILSDVSHTPPRPAVDDPIIVTAAVEASSAPIGVVTLHYRIMYEDTVSVPMFDDGAHNDGSAEDGVYGATIPSSAHRAGEMVRYYVTAADQANHTSRWPLFHDPVDSPRYLGTVTADPSVHSALPILYWFVQDIANARELQGARAQVFYDGVFYDNVFVRSRGYSSRSGWPKKSFKFEFNTGHPFRFSPEHEPVQEFNLNNTYSDKAYVRQSLAWETYRDAGVPYSICFLVRVEQNGAFHSVAVWTEHSDKRYLERQGLDPNGALYKMFNGADSATSQVEKKMPRDQDHSDLQALLDNIHLSGEVRTSYLFENVNIPAVVNYLAVTAVIHDIDCDRKNYFLYRDAEGTGEWTFLPWDKDLTFGRNFDGHVLNDKIWADLYPQSYPFSLARNDIISALYDTPAIREMYLRRLRTIMDTFLQPPGTPVDELYYERRIDELVAQIQPDVTLDRAKWPFEWGSAQTFAQAIGILKHDYLAARRVYLYETLSSGTGGIIPGAQPVTATVEFGNAIEFDPLSGDQHSEYFTLVNRNSYAVDVSGWTIAGDVRYTLQPGVVIPAGGTLYVSPDVVAFRSRAVSPTGREGRFVQGDYRGRLSNRWGILKLHNANGVLVDTKAFYDLAGLFGR
jgi:hypothetical protein